VAYNMLMCR